MTDDRLSGDRVREETLSEGRDNVWGEPVSIMGRRAFVKALGAGLLLTMAAPVLSSCESFGEAVTGERTISDHVGRELEIPTPSKLEKVYFTSGLAQVFCFTLNPELLAGTAIQFTKRQLQYLPEEVNELAYMGSLSGDGEINREMLMVEGVQLVFSISAIGLTEANISEAQKLQDSTNIPVCLLDGSMDRISDCYSMLGSILGREDRASKLAAYCSDVYERVTAAVDGIPEDEKISLYYAEGPEGLQTEPDASQHALVLAVAGANNVAAVPENEGLGMSNVSLEQVMAWSPDVIISWDYENMGGAVEDIRSNKNWAQIPATRSGRVYAMPSVPFAWLDRPPGVNRFLGVQWVANMLYPDRYDVDMVQVAREFYRLFYWVEPSEDEIKDLLGNSYPPYRG
ncbi:ABC transporter substrate-binding protein [Gordonibacter sp. 28C]|uniref:ABC transporter substrate-binding protein n=1 Tax=Gordonibacter sp. 28C TaxID=2078569 RepID=UPI000DF855FD|nr:ABC transporter substrate-binding protein [Gordonibacter sp. 28C]RDB63159.1 ABC transporter substrate-binding protein [Gordonibacter sp. 28C]